FKNLNKTLQRAAGTLKDIVWMTVSISDGRYSQRFTDIREEIYEKEFPASTLLTAAAFAVPEIMVAITAIDVVAASDRNAATGHCLSADEPRRSTSNHSTSSGR